MGILLGILFTALKVVLALLIILVVLLLLVLFVPVRYTARLQTEGGFCANAKATWLLHLLSYRAVYRDKIFDSEIRLAFFPLTGRSKESENASEGYSDHSYSAGAAEFGSDASSPSGYAPGTSSGSGAVNDQTSGRAMRRHAMKAVRAEKKRKKKGIEEEEIFAEDFGRKSFFERIKDFFKKIREIAGVAAAAKRAFADVKTYIYKLVRHIFPKKLEGNIDFGFDDPSATGNACALISVFYPVIPEKLDIEPDFTKKTFSADVTVSGRIVLFIVLINCLKIFSSKEVRRFKKIVSK